MNPLRIKLIRRTILTALKHADGYAVPEVTLRPHVEDLLRPPLSDVEWAGNIKWLSEGKRIVAVPSDLDDSLVQWAITEHGRTLLATL